MALTHDKDLPKSGESPLGPPDLKVHENIADTLRLAREEHGQDLRTVAQVLRIRYLYLEAIEKGDFEVLPGTAYAIGFLRTYAEFLGLDGEKIIERYKQEVHGIEPKLDLVFPEPVAHNRIPGGAIVLISMVLLGMAYGGWFYISNEGTDVADLMPALPESLQAMIPGGDDGQGAATPAYTPPESIDAENPAPAGTADMASAGDADTLATAETVAQDDAAPVETAPIDAAPTVAAPIVAAPVETPVAETAVPAPEISTPAPEVADSAETPEIEAVEIIETPVPETAPTAPAAAAEPTPIEPEFSVVASDSMSVPVSHTATAGSVEPMLDETVVIPSPPATNQDLALSDNRSPRVYGQSNAGTRIVLRAVQDSWVQVRDRQDALLLTRVLRIGDTYYVPNQDGLTLLTGNAGGIAIEVDGTVMAPIGPVGAVRRQIVLDPTRLLNGTALPH